LVDSAIRTIGKTTAGTFTPIVPMRLATVKGTSVRELLARGDTLHDDTTSSNRAARGRRGGPGGGGSLWAYRREYRSTYRASLGSAEKVTKGVWFGAGPWGSGRAAEDPVPISMETSLAGELSVGVGDVITWDL
jgi:putative ABC transport system permease protein